MIEYARKAADLQTFTQEALVYISFKTPLYCD